MVGNVVASPEANISTNVAVAPLGGSTAAVAPDFSMTAAEVQPVTRTMRALGWDVGCLYSQETDEHPQLYLPHRFAVGAAYGLAHQVRRGLVHTAVD